MSIPQTHSPLSYDELVLPAGSTAHLSAGTDDIFVFVFSGGANVRFGAEATDAKPTRLESGHAIYVPAGSSAELEASADGLVAVRANASADCDEHAPLGATELVASLATADTEGATGKRTFQILFGPENGSCRATLFVGYIPPGKAPWHFHQYDEIVWIRDGHGRFHTAERATEVTERDGVRISPRQVHILENLSESDELIVLGLFTPAGSPAAAFLATDPRL